MKIKDFLTRYEMQVFGILRIVTGFLFLWHGSQKLFAFPPAGHPFPSYVILIAGPIEFFGGLLVMIGLWARWAAFFCSGEMAYAYWMVHSKNALLPLLNGGELAIIYCFLFLFIIFKGSGAFSIDSFFQNRRFRTR